MAAKKKAKAKVAKVAKVRDIKSAKKQPAKVLPNGLTQKMVDSQWKPGQSGNPAGRKKQKTLEEMLREFLQSTIGEGEDAMTRMEAMVRVIFSEGVSRRNSKVLIAIMDRLYPKPMILKAEIEVVAEVAVRPDLSHLTVKELEQISKLRKRVAAGASE